jgi:hypothetical protein
MQAVGMVNDHLVGCFRFRELQKRLEPRRTQSKNRGKE